MRSLMLMAKKKRGRAKGKAGGGAQRKARPEAGWIVTAFALTRYLLRDAQRRTDTVGPSS
jgi:hypothetical protein